VLIFFLKALGRSHRGVSTVRRRPRCPSASQTTAVPALSRRALHPMKPNPLPRRRCPIDRFQTHLCRCLWVIDLRESQVERESQTLQLWYDIHEVRLRFVGHIQFQKFFVTQGSSASTSLRNVSNTSRSGPLSGACGLQCYIRSWPPSAYRHPESQPSTPAQPTHLRPGPPASGRVGGSPSRPNAPKRQGPDSGAVGWP